MTTFTYINPIAGARAVAERVVAVETVGIPKIQDGFGNGDALNAASWVLTNQDTGATLTVIEIEESSTTLFLLKTLEFLGRSEVTFRVDGSLVRSPSEVPFGASAIFDFPGLISDANQDANSRAVAAGLETQDLQNQAFSTAAGGGGTLTILPSGDYQNVAGNEFVKKMLIRRLTTPQGAFFHLPQYGTSIGAKSLFNPSQLPTIQAEIERQALLEPEVESVKASLQQNAQGVLYLSLRARLRRTGSEVVLALNNLGSVAL